MIIVSVVTIYAHNHPSIEFTFGQIGIVLLGNLSFLLIGQFTFRVSVVHRGFKLSGSSFENKHRGVQVKAGAKVAEISSSRK